MIVNKTTDTTESTTKYLIQLSNESLVEALFFNIEEDAHLCISCMVGCPVRCTFCASGLHGITRSLSSAEITEQVKCVLNDSKVSNAFIVYQGMGEPLLNLDNVTNSMKEIRELFPETKGFSISTVGTLPGLKRLINKDSLLTNLYFSLHAITDEERVKIIPFAKDNPISDILILLEEMSIKLNRKITVSYLIFKGINDTEEHMYKLAELINPQYFKVQILLYNYVDGLDYLRPENEVAFSFLDFLLSKGIETFVMISKGKSIEGGCGQLALKKTTDRQKGST